MELLWPDKHCSIPPPLLREKGEGGSNISFSWKTLEKWKNGNVTRFSFGAFSSCNCFFVQFRTLWIVTKQLLPCQYNVLSVVTPSFHFPYRSSSQTYCLNLHIITALYRLKEANLLGEKLTVGLGIVPDTSASSIKLRFVKNLNLIFLLLTLLLSTVLWWNIYKFILKHCLLYLILIYELHTKQPDGWNKNFRDSSFCFSLSVRAFYVSVFSFFSVPFPYNVRHPLSISGSDKNMWL